MKELKLFKYSLENGILSEYLENLIKTSNSYLLVRKLFFIVCFPLIKTFTKPSKKTLMFYKWITTNGDNKITNFPLNSNSVVFEIGGYLGHFSQRIINRFDSRVFIFEPLKVYFDFLKLKFHDNPKVKMYNFGLGAENSTKYLSIAGSGSSFYKNLPSQEKVKIRKFSDFFIKSGLNSIDHVMINIEGGEYDLIPNMIKMKLLNKCKYIQIQFHNFMSGSSNKRQQILKSISKTHDKVYSYPFVLEGFVKK